MYRITEYVVEIAPVSGSSETWDLSLGWTDETGPATGAGVRTSAGNLGPGSDGTFSPGGTAIISAVAGQPVTYSVGLEGQDSGGTYSVYLAAEKL